MWCWAGLIDPEDVGRQNSGSDPAGHPRADPTTPGRINATQSSLPALGVTLPTLCLRPYPLGEQIAFTPSAMVCSCPGGSSRARQPT